MPGIQELIVIAVVALLVFGPNRLPEVARNAARIVARLRVETERSVSELKRAAAVDGLDEELKDLRRELREARRSVSQSFDGRAATNARTASATPAAGPVERPPPIDPEAT